MTPEKNRAVVVGGSSGIGLAVSLYLIGQGFHIDIVSRNLPDSNVDIPGDAYTFHRCDLMDFDKNLFETLSRDPNVRLLFISAGVGAVAEFASLHIGEIEKLFRINAVSAVKILRIFYDRISGAAPFYCGVMGSIAGLVASPLFSVYAASKAAVCRFVESVNIELKMAGTANRILNIAPGALQGTRFHGGENDLSRLGRLPEEIVRRMMGSETLFIPDYEAVYKDVLRRYQSDPVRFGEESYAYKKQSGRQRSKTVVGYLSGTFDLFHIGHLNILKRAKEACDYLIVGVHESGAWKGKETFIPLEERMQIVAACRYVDEVVISDAEDSDTWFKLRYDRLFVGSDYKGSQRFIKYEAFFRDKGVEIVYFPYTKTTSSTQLRKALTEKEKKQENGE